MIMANTLIFFRKKKAKSMLNTDLLLRVGSVHVFIPNYYP